MYFKHFQDSIDNCRLVTSHLKRPVADGIAHGNCGTLPNNFWLPASDHGNFDIDSTISVEQERSKEEF